MTLSIQVYTSISPLNSNRRPSEVPGTPPKYTRPKTIGSNSTKLGSSPEAVSQDGVTWSRHRGAGCYPRSEGKGPRKWRLSGKGRRSGQTPTVYEDEDLKEEVRVLDVEPLLPRWGRPEEDSPAPDKAETERRPIPERGTPESSLAEPLDHRPVTDPLRAPPSLVHPLLSPDRPLVALLAYTGVPSPRTFCSSLRPVVSLATPLRPVLDASRRPTPDRLSLPGREFLHVYLLPLPLHWVLDVDVPSVSPDETRHTLLLRVPGLLQGRSGDQNSSRKGREGSLRDLRTRYPGPSTFLHQSFSISVYKVFGLYLNIIRLKDSWWTPEIFFCTNIDT